MIKAKNLLLVFFFIILVRVPVFAQDTDQPRIKRKFLTITVKGNYYSISDPLFEELYDPTQYFPEGEIQLRLSGNLYMWGSYALVSGSRDWYEWSDKGLVDPDFLWENTLKKHHYSLGAGYFIGLLEPGEFCINFQLGVTLITNQDLSEKFQISSGTLTDSISESETDFGINGELGISYTFWKNLFAEAFVGYLYASEVIEDEREEIGGLRLGLGLGIRF